MTAIKSAIKFEVSKLVDGKRKKLDELNVYCPSLAELGIQAEPTGTDEATGELVYASNVHKFVYGAIVQAVKTATRNKLQPQSADLRVGAKIAENLEELTTPAEGNKGTALVERRQLFDLFKQWLASAGKSETVIRVLLAFFEKPEMLLTQAPDKQAKIVALFTEFGEAASERLTDWQVSYLAQAIEIGSGAELDF